MIEDQKKKITAYAGFSIGRKSFYVSVQHRNKKLFSEYVKLTKKNVAQEILLWIKDFNLSNNFKIVAAVFAGKKALNELTSQVWLNEDMVPFFFKSDSSENQQQADNAALEAMNLFDELDNAKVSFGQARRVRTTRLVRLEDFEKITSSHEMKILNHFAEKFKLLSGKIVFISSTPKGGGVALMRHALIRMFRLLGVDADWHVMSPQKNVFEITKKNFTMFCKILLHLKSY